MAVTVTADTTLAAIDQAIEHAWRAGHLDIVDQLLDHRLTLADRDG